MYVIMIEYVLNQDIVKLKDILLHFLNKNTLCLYSKYIDVRHESDLT